MEPTTQPIQLTEVIPKSSPLANELHQKKNIYPLVRHVFIIAVTLATISIAIFLIYQNGKSIYDNGL